MIKSNLPVILLKNLVLLPYQEIRVEIKSELSKKVTEISKLYHDGEVLIVCPLNSLEEKPDTSDLPKIGVVGKIKSVIDLPNGNMRVIISGLYRVKVISYVNYSNEEDVLDSIITTIDNKDSEIDLSAYSRKLVSELENYLEKNPFVSNSIVSQIKSNVSLDKLTDLIGNYLPLSFEKDVSLMLDTSAISRSKFLIKEIAIETAILDLEGDIETKIKKSLDDSQKEFILKEKIKVIKDELGETKGKEEEVIDFKNKVKNGNFPERICKKLESEIERYNVTSEMSPDSGVIRNYIEYLLSVPWYTETKDEKDLVKIEKKLNLSHYGMDKAKMRIIEYIAVKSIAPDIISPIICLVGPPGVGKTSLAKSIARALGRKFVKASLGGLYDEAELRGHRRTYVGAMPGKIIKGINNAKVTNPVFLLDEIDKMASSNKGDPSSALLEILDPEQNSVFQDNYLEETYDLSNVLFIATANYLQNVPAPLRDRLELIELNSYTDVEKFHIAKEHLIAKQAQINGLTLDQIEVPDETIYELIRFYTREAGVRELERLISTLCRKSVVELMRNENLEKIIISPSKVKEYLGQRKYEYSKKEKDNQVGIVTGLAYTEFGGDILPIEVTSFEGKGEFIVTGNLGNVMKESTSIALDYVKANAAKYQIDPKFFENHTIHIHCPEGAVPKDGPSAGIAITTAIVSSLTGRKVSSLVAMTGEVNLRGFALPIGGLKEKTLAALRSGIKTVIIPKDNEKDLEKISPEVKDNLNIVLMNTVDDALKIALVD